MKKSNKNLILILLIVVTTLVSTTALAACKTKGRLQKPELTANEALGRVDWNSVKNASNYRVSDSLDGKEQVSYCSSTSYYPSTAGTHVISVVAQGDGVKFKNSEKAEIVITVTQTVLDKIYGVNRASLGKPRDLPFRYAFAAGSSSDFKIGLDLASPVSVSAVGLTEGGYSFSNGELTLGGAYLSQFSEGAAVAFSASGAGGKTVEFYMCAAAAQAARVTNLPYGIAAADKNAPTDLNVAFDKPISAQSTVPVSVNGVHPAAFSEDFDRYFSLSSDKKNLTVKKALVSLLDKGVNSFTVHLDGGTETVFKLDVDTDEFELYNVAFEFDKYPGRLVVEWNCDYEGEAVFSLGDDENRTVNSTDNASLFVSEGNSRRFDITGAGFDDERILTLRMFVGTEQKTLKYVYFKKPTQIEKLYINDTYEYLGEIYNYYISGDAELEIFVHHALLYDAVKRSEINSTEGYLYTKGIFVDPDKISHEGVKNDEGIIADALALYLSTYREAVKPGNKITVLKTGRDTFTVSFAIFSYTEPKFKSDGAGNNAKLAPKLEFSSATGRDAAFDAFKIDSIEKTASVKTSDQLYFAVEAGLRPVCAEDSAALRMYQKARVVLREICDDGMNDYRKARAIFEWICGNTVYDHATVNAMGGISVGSSSYNKFYGYNCFYLEGVFDDGVAVCNGLAKAFVLMCRIEGIEAVKENGYALPSPNETAHAWNKVNIDGVWYVCDPTWALRKTADVRVVSDAEGVKITLDAGGSGNANGDFEYYSPRFFLMSGEELLAADNYRKPDPRVPLEFTYGYLAGDTAFDIFSSDTFAYEKDGATFVGDHTVKDADDMTALAIYYFQNKAATGFAVEIVNPLFGADKTELLKNTAATYGLTLQKIQSDFTYKDGGSCVVYYKIVR